jgi:hypothetical protein
MTKWALAGGAMFLAIAVPLRSQQPAAWKDPASHSTRFIQVAQDVRLEVVDWGGTGRPLVLLAGGGDTAHVFDDFAPKLAGEFHVYGITRRGFGESSFAPVDLGAQTWGDDVVAVLDALKLEKPILDRHTLSEPRRGARVFRRRVSLRVRQRQDPDVRGNFADGLPADAGAE